MLDTKTRRAAARRIMLQATSRNFMAWYEPRLRATEAEQPLHVFAALFQDIEGVEFFDAMPPETILVDLQQLIDELPVITPLGHEDAQYVALIRSWMVDALASARDAEFFDALMFAHDARMKLEWLLFKRKRVANTRAHRHLNEDAKRRLVDVLNRLTPILASFEEASKAVR